MIFRKRLPRNTPIPSMYRADTRLARRPRPHNSTPFNPDAFSRALKLHNLKIIFGFSSTGFFAAAAARQKTLICCALLNVPGAMAKSAIR
jgi:hypothetical protein